MSVKSSNKARLNRVKGYETFSFEKGNTNNPFLHNSSKSRSQTRSVRKSASIMNNFSNAEMEKEILDDILFPSIRNLAKDIIHLYKKVLTDLVWAANEIVKKIKQSKLDTDDLKHYHSTLRKAMKKLVEPFMNLTEACTNLSDGDNSTFVRRMEREVKVIRGELSKCLDIRFPMIRINLMRNLHSVSGILPKLKKVVKMDGNKTRKSINRL
jgi:hypothetical protein